ncbi:hypothetical protein MN116_008633, partial [Schistosoma mekongi]
MNDSLINVKLITPTWNEKRHQLLLILIIHGIIANILLIIIVYVTQSLFKKKLKYSLQKCNKVQKINNKFVSTKYMLQSLILSKCCAISNDEETFIIESNPTQYCCEFEMNLGCCFYKTQCHNHCFSTSSTITSVPITNELSNQQNDNFNNDCRIHISKLSKNHDKSSSIQLYNVNNKAKCLFENTGEPSLNYQLSTLSNTNKLNITKNTSNYELTLPSTSHHLHYKSITSLCNKVKLLNIEQTTWYILCYLIKMLAIAQIGYLIFDDLLPWLSNLLIFYFGYNIKLKLNINCQLKRMFSTFFLLFEEWCLFLFGIERIYNVVYINYNNNNNNNNNNNKHTKQSLINEYNHNRLYSLSIKISTCLFIAIIFAALCNYLWIFGQFDWINSMQYINYTNNNLTLINTVTCNVRSEYFQFYYSFLIYLDPLFSFLLPHSCSIIFSIIILYCICFQLIYQQINTNVIRKITMATIETPTTKTTTTTSTSMSTILIQNDNHLNVTIYQQFITLFTMIDHLTTIIFLLDSFLIVTLKLWRNIEKTMM